MMPVHGIFTKEPNLGPQETADLRLQAAALLLGHVGCLEPGKIETHSSRIVFDADGDIYAYEKKAQ